MCHSCLTLDNQNMNYIAYECLQFWDNKICSGEWEVRCWCIWWNGKEFHILLESLILLTHVNATYLLFWYCLRLFKRHYISILIPCFVLCLPPLKNPCNHSARCSSWAPFLLTPSSAPSLEMLSPWWSSVAARHSADSCTAVQNSSGFRSKLAASVLWLLLGFRTLMRG